MKTHLLPRLKQFIFVSLSFFISITSFAQTKTRVTGAANWNTNSTWVKTLSGGVTCVLILKTVLGFGTSFTTELAPGDVLSTIDGQQIGTVASISNNTTLTLVSNAAILLTLATNYGVEKVPTATDDVEIGNSLLGTAVSVTLNTASATVNSLSFIADNLSNTLTHAGTNSLTVNNAVVINQPTNNAKTIAWNINGGTANVNGNISFTGVNTTASRIAKMVITTGTLNANADMIFSGSTAATKVIDMSGFAGAINLKGALTVPASSATLTAGTSGSIFNYTGTAAQTINFFPSGKYDNLQINNTNASGATLSAAIATSNVDGDLSVGNNNTGSLFNTAGNGITLNNSRRLTISAGSTLDAGTSIINFGTGTPNLTINGTFKTANVNGFSGSTTTAINSTNPPTFILGVASTIEYNSASNQQVTGRTDYANIAVSGGATKTAAGDITANTNLNIGTATTMNAAAYIHYMRGSLTSSGSFVASSSTMIFCGSGAQTIPALVYNNLETSTGGIKTPSAGLTIAGNFVIGASTVFDASTFTHGLAGDFTNNGMFTMGSSTFDFNGSVNQQINGITSFYNVTLDNPAELSIANKVTINGALTLNNGRFYINGKTLKLNGSFSGTNTHALKGSAASTLIIGNSFNSGTLYFDQSAGTDNNFLKDFTLKADASVGNNLNIAAGSSPGTVDLTSGVTLTTNDYLTMKSDGFGTARLAELPVDGAGAATAFINGKVTIERYIPAARGWRLLSAPVKTSGAPTINEAWQEGLTTASPNPNLYPGYGVKICGGSSVNGYDTSSTNNPFIKIYNSSGNNFVALPSSPGTHVPISTYPAYFLYIRGDRSVDMLQGLGAAITSTTLRTKGQVVTGKQDITVNSTSFSMLGNPYASAIDFHSLTKSNVADAFYAWDPKLAGAYGIGGYVTFSWNNATGSYDATGSVSNITQYIQSGSAVLISSADNTNPGTISVKESDKTDLGSDQVSRPAAIGQKLRVNLYLSNADSTSSLLDGILTTYDDANSNSVDNNDAKKIYGSNQSINIRRDSKMLAIERRKTITSSDTSFINLYQMKAQNYILEIVAQNLGNTGMQAILKDNYASATNDLPLQMDGNTTVPFTVTADPASYAVDRFKIVFKALAPLPISFKTAKVYQQQKNIVVEWQTENEVNYRQYEIEKSMDGKSFNKISTNTITAMNSENNRYTFIDTKAVTGMNYYRIVSIPVAGNKNYSSTLKLNIADGKDQPGISVYPNPVTGNIVNVKVNNIEAGLYSLQVFNMGGQLVSVKTIKYDGSSTAGNIEINDKLPAGKYQLRLNGGKISLNTQLIKK